MRIRIKYKLYEKGNKKNEQMLRSYHFIKRRELNNQGEKIIQQTDRHTDTQTEKIFI